MRYLSKETYAGGILAIANHVEEFCGSVDLLTYLGETDNHEHFIRERLKPNIRPIFIKKSGSPTIIKRRFVEKYAVTKMLEVYEINDDPLTAEEEDEFCANLEATLGEYDAVIVADFGHGLI